MLNLKTRLGRALSQATFDERYYRLVHADVNRAIDAGQIESGYLHYVSFGRGERRSVRRTWLPGVPVPRYFAMVKPNEDFFSGLKFVFPPQPDARYRLRLYRVAGMEKVVDVEIDAEAELEDGVGFVYWEPVEQARDQRFLARVTRIDGGRAAPVDFLATDDYVYSSPHSPRRVPWLVAMSPLTQCNLNCIHCISRHTRTAVRELSPEIWATFEEMARRGEVLHMCSDYSGDIFFAQGRRTPWLDRLIDLKVELRLDTHANNLTPEAADKVLRAKLLGINFSIDSHDPEDYPKIRKGARPLPEVLDNIAGFMAKRNKRRPDVQTSLSLVMMRRNLSSLIPAIDFAHKHKIDVVQGTHLMVFTEDMLESHVLLDLPAYRRAHAEASAHARALGVTFLAPAPLAKRKTRGGHQPCNFPWNGVQVTGDGNVTPCCIPGDSLGNLNAQSLEEIWNGPTMQAFRRKVNTPNPPKACDECGMFRYENNLRSFVPGLPREQQEAFIARVLAQV